MKFRIGCKFLIKKSIFIIIFSNVRIRILLMVILLLFPAHKSKLNIVNLGGMVRTWHRRWFCLNGDCLFYFAKEDDLKPVGSLFLPGNRVSEIQWTPDDSDKYLFEICPG
jgi:hypothetical protein